MHFNRRTVRCIAVVSLSAAAAVTMCCAKQSSWGSTAGLVPQSALARTLPLPESRHPTIATDEEPLDLLHRARARYDRSVRTYRCVLTRQEFLNGRLNQPQQIAVTFRQSPLSIGMDWIRNPGRVRRIVYVKDRDRGPNGAQRALVEPEGTLARLVTRRFPIEIHSPTAQSASRYPIDQFGFRSTIDRLIRVCEKARQRGDLQLTFAADGEVDGRPTFVIVRRLPYTGPDGMYPDALLVIHLDREWLLPVAMHSYSDANGQFLLGSYVITKVRLNPKVNDSTFEL